MDAMLLLLGIIFLIAGILVLYSGVKELIKARKSKNWPATTGKIVSSEVCRSTVPRELIKAGNDGKLPDSVEKLISTQASTSRGKPDYEAEVFYKYSVNDIEYSSNVVSFRGWSSNSPKNAQRIVNRYPPGKEVTVYYDKDMPEESVLESGTTFGCYFSIIFALIFVVVGIYLLFYFN